MEAREKVKQSTVFVCTFRDLSRPGGEKARLDDKSKSVLGNRMNEPATTRRPEKVLAVASGGGHWMQLMRLVPALNGYEVIFVTVSDPYRSVGNLERVRVEASPELITTIRSFVDCDPFPRAPR